ncbi:YIP1 family protein [Bacillus smithii]|uniref:YIP1 family protein n=1 Tax=Bacillus smithii TaxID=1479 RepID=UPI00399D21A1
MNIWLNPNKFFKKEITPNKLLFINLFVLLFAIIILDLSMINILNINGNRKIIVFFLISTLITIPFYYIVNFIFSVLLSIILVFFKRDLSVLKLYSIVCTSNCFNLLFNTVGLYIILINNDQHVFYTLNIVLLIMNVLSIRILYFGLINYVKVTKKISFVLSFVIISIMFIFTGYGGIHYAG